MIEEYKVLDLKGNPIKRKYYQKEMVKFYREMVDVCEISNDSQNFFIPYEGILRFDNNETNELVIILESEDEFELECLKNTATINGKFII